jgi:hypothetical protein
MHLQNTAAIERALAFFFVAVAAGGGVTRSAPCETSAALIEEDSSIKFIRIIALVSS